MARGSQHVVSRACACMTNTAVFGCATTGNTSFRRCKGVLSKCKHFSNSNSVPSTLGSRASGSGSGGNTKNSPQQGLSFSLQKRSASFTSTAAAAAGAAASAPKSGGSGSGGYLSGAFQSGSHLSFILESKRSTSAVVRAASGSEAAQAQPPAEDGSSTSDNLDSADTGRNSKGLPSWFPMHDFCLTLPWGLFVALGGVAGFAIAGSTKSLIFGGGFGALLMVLGVLSLTKWKVGGGLRGKLALCIPFFFRFCFSRSNPARVDLNSFHTRR